MNLLKALNAIDAAQKPASDADSKQPPTDFKENAPPPPEQEYPNVMQSVLVRHEQISNRVKKNTPR